MNSTPESLREIWQSWGIRGFIILSISLQIFLFLASSLRRKTGNMVVYFLIWSAYLLADWVPTFTTGLILNGLSTNASCATSTTGPGRSDNLLAIWAASLLGHLGGNFTVTVFSLEDNELWFRHPVVLVVQFGTAFYVFLCSLPHNKFLLPTIFILVSGLISYALRVYSMHHASLNKYREDILREPYRLDHDRTKRLSRGAAQQKSARSSPWCEYVTDCAPLF